MSGIESIPWQSQNTWIGDELVVSRSESDSGCLYVPWLLSRRGPLVLSTATLMERPRPYLLEVELARGTVHELREHLASWKSVGLVVRDDIVAGLKQAMAAFAAAASKQAQPEVAARFACDAIEQGVELSYALGRSYAEQALAVRRQSGQQLTTLLGAHLGPFALTPRIAGEVSAAFNLASIPMSWREIEAHEGRRDWATSDAQIEWSQRAGLKVCGGPLLRLHPSGIPDWMYLWENDYENLLAFMLDHVKAVVMRYRGRVHLWQCASRINVGNLLGLGEEERLRIVVRIVELIRSLDPRTPVVATFDKPWAEYIARESWDLSPLHFADALVRADIGLAGIGLELNIGTGPEASLPRTPLAFSRLFDHWSLLGVPIMVITSSANSLASRPPPVGAPPEPPGSRQREWVEDFMPLMLAKNSVQVVVWNQIDDAVHSDFPESGLVDRRGAGKPALAALQKLRRTYLQ